MGWGRTYHYYRHRIFRTGDSTYKITAGLATGAAVSWSPFLGTHFLQALFLSWLLKANLLAGFIGTAWGNPWTFPVMFFLSYKLGAWLCGLFGLERIVSLPDRDDFSYFMDHPLLFLDYLFAYPLHLLLPLTIGGYLFALLFWPLTYVTLYYPVRLARRTYRLQRMKRRAMKRRRRGQS